MSLDGVIMDSITCKEKRKWSFNYDALFSGSHASWTIYGVRILEVVWDNYVHYVIMKKCVEQA